MKIIIIEFSFQTQQKFYEQIFGKIERKKKAIVCYFGYIDL